MADAIPEQIGRYRIERVLGRGGVGTVYSGHDPAIQRPVAIKLLVAHGAEAEQRFMTEVRATGNLNHPNVAGVFDVGRTDQGQIYIVQELIEGVDLGRIVQAHPRGLEPRVSTGVLLQVARALSHAHQRGIVHRDVKPSNVLVLADGRAKLLDFGIARLVDTASETTSPGTIVGTPQYMSPEQIRGDLATASVDIYSFGVLAYELLTGRRPFVAESFAATVFKVMTEEPAPILGLVGAEPDGDLARLVERCLAKQAADRPASMDEVVEALERLPREWDANLVEGTAQTEPVLALPILPTPLSLSATPLAPTARTGTFRVAGDLVGATVGRFVLHERIAKGKTGDLYKAWDPVRSGLVGLKVIHADDEASRDRLLRGGRIWLGLNHPHIVKVFEVHPDYGGHPGIVVTELVEGSNLDEFVAQRQLDLHQVVWIGIQVCDALAAIHALNVIHREVKPRNILVSGEDLHVTLLDSGIARHTNPEIDAFTKTGVFVGDLAYAAPELADGRGDQRSDVYAVVAVLYELLAQHRLPFPMAHDWTPDATMLDALPKRLRDTLERGLRRDPRARFASITELRDQLRPLVAERRNTQAAKVVVALHGIRTQAAWQRALSEIAGRHGISVHVDRWNFGYFSALRFLMPWSRLAKVRWFRHTYQQEFQGTGEGARHPSIVAHSFGTYILGNALLRYPYLRFDKVLLCGSILPRGFPWDRLIERGQVQSVRNEFGRHDIWTKAVAWFVSGTGPSGLVGFTAPHPRLTQERFEFDHSEYFDRAHMEDRWLPFLEAEIEQRPTRELEIDVPSGDVRTWGLYALYSVMLAVIATLILWRR